MATGLNNTTPVVDPITGQVMSYEEYVRKTSGAITDNYDSAITDAADQKTSADATVNAAYQTAIDNAVGVQTAADATAKGVYNAAVGAAGLSREEAEGIAGTNLANQQADIEAAYKRAQVGYGRQAEGLARAGLTGSGYSDNLTRDAYAARASGNMSAQKAYGEAMLAAQTEEARAIADAEAAYKLSLAGNLAAYNSAAATAAAARDTGLAYNLTEYNRVANSALATQQREQAALDKFQYEHTADVESTKQKAYNDILLNVGTLTPALITQMADNAGLTDDDKTALLDAQSAVYGAKQLEYYGIESPQELSILATAGDASAYQRVQDAIAAGMIQKSDEKTYRNAWASAAEEAFKPENLASMSAEDAREMLALYKSSGWANETDAETYENAVNAVFNPVASPDHTFTYTGSRDLSEVGRNFVIEDEEGGKYRVESDGEETSARIVSMANKLDAGTVFKNGKGLYVVMNVNGEKKVYKIRKRGNKDGYDDINSAFSKTDNTASDSTE